MQAVTHTRRQSEDKLWRSKVSIWRGLRGKSIPFKIDDSIGVYAIRFTRPNSEYTLYSPWENIFSIPEDTEFPDLGDMSVLDIILSTLQKIPVRTLGTIEFIELHNNLLLSIPQGHNLYNSLMNSCLIQRMNYPIRPREYWTYTIQPGHINLEVPKGQLNHVLQTLKTQASRSMTANFYKEPRVTL